MSESIMNKVISDDLALRLQKLSDKMQVPENQLISHAVSEYLQKHEHEDGPVNQESSEALIKALANSEGSIVDQKARLACQTLLQRIESLEKALNQTISDVEKLKEYDRKQDEEDMVSPVLGW